MLVVFSVQKKPFLKHFLCTEQLCMNIVKDGIYTGFSYTWSIELLYSQYNTKL